MTIYVVFKHYRQINGEYVALQIMKAFVNKDDAEAFVKNNKSSWIETKEVPLAQGNSMQVEFQGWIAVHEAELEGL